MGYSLGIDLGTTFTAAAVWRDGQIRVADLGNRSASIPSVVFLRDDETILTGEAANRRGMTEPDRVAREFKRRMGDTTPIFVGGTPYSSEALTAKLLRWVVDQIAEREGGPPDRVAISHPANWGPYKQDLLDQAVRLADLPGALLLSEPEAAAIHYASQERVESGDVVAVYDLGGGTFDAAVLRKSDDAWEILGAPEGIDKLGGIDFDAAVFDHVRRALDGKLEALDAEDPKNQQAVGKLREECVEAKEALSGDTDATIPVFLPNAQTEVRLTRGEFEGMIRPPLADTIDALRRALRSAGVTPDQVSAVVLVGGSSRVPLVSQLVGAELGRPVAVDAHPKHAIPMGAALAAAEGYRGGVAIEDGGGGGAAGAVVAGAAGAAVGAAAAAAVTGGGAEPPPVEPQTEPVAAEGPPEPAPPPAAPEPEPQPAPAAATPPAEPPPVQPTIVPDRSGGGGKRRGGAAVAILAVVLVGILIGIGALVLLNSGDDGGSVATGGTSDTTPATTANTSGSTTPVTEPGSVVDACETDESNLCITDVFYDGDDLVVDYATNLTGMDTANSSHAHFFLFSETTPDNAGTNGDGTGSWRVWQSLGQFSAANQGPGDDDPFTRAEVDAVGATRICVLRADAAHAVTQGTGNCADIPL